MSEAQFHASLTRAHNAAAGLFLTANQLQLCVKTWESLPPENAKILAEIYLKLRGAVWHFSEEVVSLKMIFNDLAGGLVSSLSSDSPIEEHGPIHQAAREVSLTVW